MKIIDKVALIHLDNKKILMSLSKGKDTYYLPGGKRIGNENDIEVLTREIKEELSVEIIKESVKYYGTFIAHAHGKDEDIQVNMTCYLSDYEGELKPDNEIEEIVFFNYADKYRISEVDKLIYDDLYKKGYLE